MIKNLYMKIENILNHKITHNMNHACEQCEIFHIQKKDFSSIWEARRVWIKEFFFWTNIYFE
jgi:predicted methyltransferase